jgi:hypothetical protein
MRKILGVLLVLSGVCLLVMIFYFKFGLNDEKLSWFSLILPALFIFQGLSYTKDKKDMAAFKLKEQRNNDAAGITFEPDKRAKLIAKLKNMTGELVVPVVEFFDGNTSDLGSIGCNLYPDHPGINTFSSILSSLESREDVDAVFVQISEIEPDEESWPYSDKVLVFGTISNDSLEQDTKQLEPTEIGEPGGFFDKIPSEISALSSEPLRILWWD